ncbi:MAG TPA: hypothetical protein DDY70_00260, partial [Clostridiales bacterium]|nr:hypothetical protein [Clostridiales bacterium]
MKNTRKTLLALLFCLLLVAGALFALTSCGECKEHTFGDWETVKAATCTEAGERRHTCTKCNETVSEPIQALGHDLKSEITTAGTCTADGVKTTTCKREGCTYSATATIDALGHDFETTVTTPATCTADGVKTTTCKHEGCDYSATETIDALGHDYETVTTPATCTADGVKTTTCKHEGCDYSATETIDALGHDYETTVTAAATCTAEGVEKLTCKREGCGYSTSRTVAKIAHTPDREEATCFAAKVCTSCHTVLEAKKAHTLTTTTVDPTCTAGGYTKVSCSNEGCDYENITATTTALPHTPDRDEPTCVLDQTCTTCHQVLAQKTGRHSYDVLLESHDADCENDGYAIKKCATCDATMKNIIEPARHHDVAAWTEDESARVLKDATDCTYTLTYKGYCSRCESDVTRTEDKVIHEFESRITTPATCVANGVKTLTCTKCEAAGGTVTYTDTNADKWIEAQDGDYLVSTCAHNCGNTKKLYNASEKTTATVPSEVLAETGSVKLKDAELALDDNVKNLLGENTELTAETLDDDLKNEALKNVSDDLKEKIGDSPIYNFGLVSGGTQIGDFNGGKITVTIPYELAEGEDPESIAIFYVDENGEIKSYPATYSNGYATFEAPHFSYYTVARLTPAERCAIYDHTYIEEDIRVTCTTDGCHLKVCRRCGRIERTDIVKAPGHWLNEGEITTDPTCLVNGVKTVSCTRENCGYHFEIALPALGHSFVLDQATSTAATCTKTGTAHYVCEHDGCDAEYTLTLPMTAHAIETRTVPVTCTTDGYTQNTCSVCGFSYRTGERAALGHSMVETVVPASCTEDGYTLHACRSCDYSFKTDTTAKHHTFDIDEPTCGQGQTCVLCGAKGLPATGKHTMADGVCSVCGQGCTHDYDTVTKAPTCTDGGYDEKTCNICGKVVRENYTSKLGHDYKNGACTRCGDKLDLSNLYYQINRSLLTTRYTFLAKNVKIVIYDADLLKQIIGGGVSGPVTPAPDTDMSALLLAEDDEVPNPDIAIVISGEFYFGFDENGEVFGYLAGDISGTVEGIEGAGNAVVILKENKVYVSAKTTKPMQSTMTAVADLKKAADMEGMPSSVAMANKAPAYILELVKWYEEDVLPILLSAMDKNADDIAASTELFLGTFFKMEDREEGGYTFTFDFDKLHALNDVLAEKKINEVIDLYFGEGSYATLEIAIPALFDLTFGDLFDVMEERGLSVNDLVDLVNALLARLKIRVSDTVTITSLDQFFSMMMGEEIAVKELLASDEVRAMNISDFVIGMISQNTEMQITKDTLLGIIADTLTNLRNHTVYTFIASLVALPEGDEQPSDEELAEIIAGTAQELKDKVDLIIEAARGYFSYSFTVSADGTVDGFVLNLNINIPNIGALTGEISAVKDYQSDIDIDKILEDSDPLELNPHSADGEEDLIFLFDEDGKLIGVLSKTYNITDIDESAIKDDNFANVGFDDNGNMVMPDTVKIRYHAVVGEYTYRMEDLVAATYQTDCGAWLAVDWNFVKYAERDAWEADFVATFEMSDIAALLGCPVDTLQPDVLMTNAWHIISSELDRTVETGERETVENEKEIRSSDNISFCYNTENHTVKNVYTMHETEKSYAFLTEEENCEAGVKVSYICKICHQITSSYVTTSHTTVMEERVTMEELGVASCDIYSIAYSSCLCGEHTDFTVNGSWHGTEESNTEIEGGTRVVTLLRCYNEDCTFRIRKTTDTVADGCDVTRTETYELVVNGETQKTYVVTRRYQDHLNLTKTCELAPGSETCDDGVIVRYECTSCGYVEEDKIYGHETTEKEFYDFADYGSVCDGTLTILECACGEQRISSFKTKYDLKYGEYIGDLVTGNCVKAYTEVCSATDCGFTILYMTIRTKDEENCTATDWYYACLGYDRATGDFGVKVLLSKDTYESHTIEYDNQNDSTALTKTTIGTCKYCNYRTEWKECFRTAEAFENGNSYRTESTEYRTDGVVYYFVREWFELDESDPRVEILRSYSPGYKVERNEWRYPDGSVHLSETRVDLDLDNCLFCITEIRDGETNSKGWMSFHDAYLYNMNEAFYEIETVSAMGSCTTPGTFRISCRFCHTAVNPFERMNGDNSWFNVIYDYPYQGEGTDRFYPVYSMYFNGEGINYDSHGYVYVNPASYNEEDGTFLVASGHNYWWNDDEGIYVCDRCGLKNKTGVDAVATLRDATTDEDKENGKLVAEFFYLTGARLMPHISLVVITTDAVTGEKVEKIIYFDTDEGWFTKTFDEENYISSDGTTFTIDFAGVMEFVNE